MLTTKMLDEMEAGEIIATGETVDSPDGINMTNSGKALRWVAVRGGGIPDWTIYIHWAESSVEWIKRSGDKVIGQRHIEKLVTCTPEAFKRYRY